LSAKTLAALLAILAGSPGLSLAQSAPKSVCSTTARSAHRRARVRRSAVGDCRDSDRQLVV